MKTTFKNGASWLSIQIGFRDTEQFAVDIKTALLSVMVADSQLHSRNAVDAACFSGLRYGRRLYRDGRFLADVSRVEGLYPSRDLTAMAECMSMCVRLWASKGTSLGDVTSSGWHVDEVTWETESELEQ